MELIFDLSIRLRGVDRFCLLRFYNFISYNSCSVTKKSRIFFLSALILRSENDNAGVS